MPSMFNARDADNYERLMGRWSRRLAPLFIEHAGIADGDNDIGRSSCGTGKPDLLPSRRRRTIDRARRGRPFRDLPRRGKGEE